MVRYLPFPVMPISIKAVIGVRRASPSFFFFFFSCLKLTMEQRARETKIKPRIFNFSAKPQQKISPFHSYPQLRYLIGCVYFGAYGVHSCPLLQTSRFLLLCSVGLPLKTQNERRGKKSRGHLVNYRWIRMRFFPLTQTHKKCKILRSLQTKRCYNPLRFFTTQFIPFSASHDQCQPFFTTSLLVNRSSLVKECNLC